MSFPIYHVDAFTNKPFAGNPAAVCLLHHPAEPQWMQQVAAEMNLAETAFLSPWRDHFELRWFTPTVEVDLCGHATLAAACVLWNTGWLKPVQAARVQTRSGMLTCAQRADWIEMNFPATPAERVEAPEGLLASLGLNSSEVTSIAKSQFDYLVELSDETRLRALAPSFAELRQIPSRGVIVTSPSNDPAYDFLARFFAPQSGIDEDPATGSAYCCLGPWWQGRLGKSQLQAYQASRRGAVIRVAPSGDRVLISGQAVITLRGELLC